MTTPRLRLVIKRKPPPPALPPFECAICEQMIERDAYSPDFQAPPICNSCKWQGQAVRLNQLPFSMWGQFRTAYALLSALDKEIARARRTH